VPVIVTYSPVEAPQRLPITGTGRRIDHECKDSNGTRHRQRLALGSVGGIFYLDALCLHCGSHFVWVDDHDAEMLAGSLSSAFDFVWKFLRPEG